ncbi:hypothetical protein MHU86_23535 [Fragilaria crotonensis]|nr:hypothetical protein MHU86_23535 [Fragilaria crotonensis]
MSDQDVELPTRQPTRAAEQGREPESTLVGSVFLTEGGRSEPDDDSNPPRSYEHSDPTPALPASQQRPPSSELVPEHEQPRSILLQPSAPCQQQSDANQQTQLPDTSAEPSASGVSTSSSIPNAAQEIHMPSLQSETTTLTASTPTMLSNVPPGERSQRLPISPSHTEPATVRDTTTLSIPNQAQDERIQQTTLIASALTAIPGDGRDEPTHLRSASPEPNAGSDSNPAPLPSATQDVQIQLPSMSIAHAPGNDTTSTSSSTAVDDAQSHLTPMQLEPTSGSVAPSASISNTPLSISNVQTPQQQPDQSLRTEGVRITRQGSTLRVSFHQQSENAGNNDPTSSNISFPQVQEFHRFREEQRRLALLAAERRAAMNGWHNTSDADLRASVPPPVAASETGTENVTSTVAPQRRAGIDDTGASIGVTDGAVRDENADSAATPATGGSGNVRRITIRGNPTGQSISIIQNSGGGPSVLMAQNPGATHRTLRVPPGARQFSVPVGVGANIQIRGGASQQTQNNNPNNPNVIQRVPIPRLEAQVIPTSAHDLAAGANDNDDEQHDNYRCTICYEFFVDPSSCGKCSSRFCHACLLRVATTRSSSNSTSSKCPACRAILTVDDIVAGFVEQYRQTRADHQAAIIALQRSQTMNTQLTEVNSGLMRRALPSPTNIFDVLNLVYTSSCTTSYFLFTSDIWRLFLVQQGAQESRAVVCNFLYMLPTVLNVTRTAVGGYRLLLTVNTEQDPQLWVGNMELGVLSITPFLLLLTAGLCFLLDGQSSMKWSTYKYFGLWERKVLRDMSTLAFLLINLVVVECDDSGSAAVFLWMCVLVATCCFPPIILTILGLAGGIAEPNPHQIVGAGRSACVVLFALRHAAVAAFLGIAPAIDGAILSQLLRRSFTFVVRYDLVPVSDGIWSSLSSAYLFGFLGVRFAIWAVESQFDTLPMLTIIATVAFLLVNFIVHQMTRLGITIGILVYREGRGNVLPNQLGVRNAFSLSGTLSFCMWCSILLVLAVTF